jgi:hypothetical protein
MYPLRQSPIAILVLTLLSGCGATPVPNPHIDFSDYHVLPDDIGFFEGGDLATMADGSKPDSGEISWGADSNPELEIEPADLPVVCWPGTASCKWGKVVQCNDGGTGYDVVDKCDDDNDCTDDGCSDNLCTHEAVSGSCCNPACEIGHLCISNECICASNCMGKECGDDGCGGSCGECEGEAQCSLTGKCKCAPDCDGKECGDNGCGGSCGTCLAPGFCQEGMCQCTPQCEGKVCGDDGCGGSCGACPALHKCEGGACAFSCSICPVIDGCTSAPFGPHVYYFCAGGKSFNGSRDRCTDHQAHLATISSAEENAFLAAFEAGSTSWIGYYQEWYTWEWRWVTGESKSFEQWAKDQPDDGGFWPPDEDCTELRPDGFWNDQECDSDRSYICEFEPPQ